MRAPTPSYEYDQEKYDAICKWLDFSPRVCGQALPEFFYVNIFRGLSQKQDGWVFDQEKSVRNFATAAGISVETLPKDGFELFFKHLYKGILDAVIQDGCDKMPKFSINKNTPRMGIGIADGNVLFLLPPEIARTIDDIEALHRDTTQQGKLALTNALLKIEGIGHHLQCRAHYYASHLLEKDTPDFSTEANEFVGRMTTARRQRQVSRN